VVGRHIAGLAGREALAALGRDRALAPLARCLEDGLARQHRDRPTMAELRRRLASIAGALASRPWPLGG
jgi:hypothetical protein